MNVKEESSTLAPSCCSQVLLFDEEGCITEGLVTNFCVVAQGERHESLGVHVKRGALGARWGGGQALTRKQCAEAFSH